MLILGNWKLNGNKNILNDFFLELDFLCKKFQIKNDISISPPIIYLSQAYRILKENKIKVTLTSQNVDIHIKGSFTGETSINMLKDLNVKYVIVGHSERRVYHKEDNKIISSKFHIVKEHNLTPVLCVGEVIKDNVNKSKMFIKSQIDTILNNLGVESFRKSIIAYEPIWAIGSNTTADPNYVNEIHFFIKEYISDKDIFFKKNRILVQYGGSVSEQNINNFINKKYIDGFLIGGASLSIKTFFPIIKILETF
ncbi:triose-phosphate isomerase [Buchnera aphidicola (Chaitoregma tattakana)]|uniref:triose-phosphate isomerase n=1 Tax=Buchnera aphidicola TaxID=9 RepID=UPI0031B80AA5